MDRERWRILEQCFHEASKLGSRERISYLERVCAGDLELGRELEALLDQDRMTQPEIRRTIEGEAEELLRDDAEAAWAGRRLGPWRTTGLLGQGGMGAVYDAVRDDQQFELRVAIKVLRLGMVSPADVARFRRERQILARLEHPHIARLLDGGEVPAEPYGASSPYIVMEHVQGVPITEYCRAHGVKIREKLELFLQVLDAVSYAHQKLVLHRDLKPHNILVTDDGTVKLLDFGVAKLVEADPAADAAPTTTLTALTPEYASPEQIRGESLSAATDVYSLGVILYEMLGERRPYSFRKTDALDTARTICEVNGPSLRLGDDLDTLLAKAMDKDQARRYSSTEQFAGDIRRFLAGRPLMARANSAGYRLKKFLGRNPIPAALVALVILSLTAGLLSSMHQARRAERRFNQVRQIANTFVFDVHDSIATLVGATKARELVVGKALEYLKSLERESPGDPDLQYELATAYQKVADVQGRATGANLGDRRSAQENYRKAEKLLRDALAERPNMEAARIALMDVLQHQGQIHVYAGDLSQASECYRRAMVVANDFERGGRSSVGARHQLATLLMAMSDLQRPAGDAKGAMASAERAMGILEELAAEVPDNDAVRNSLAVALSSIARAKANSNDLEGARQARKRSIEVLEELKRKAPQDATVLRNLLLAYAHLGDILGSTTLPSLGDRAGAEQAYRHALSMAEALSSADGKNQRARTDYAIALTRLGQVIPPERAPEALSLYRHASELFQTILDADPENLNVAMNMAVMFELMGERRSETGDQLGALQSIREAHRLCQRIFSQKSGETGAERVFMAALAREVDLLVRNGRRGEAQAVSREAMALAERQVKGRTPFASGLLNARAYAIQASAGSGEQACRSYQSSLQSWNAVRNDKAYTVFHDRERKQAEAAASKCP
jgi:eukaryotic-like serine/threonine-protein kinase